MHSAQANIYQVPQHLRSKLPQHKCKGQKSKTEFGLKQGSLYAEWSSPCLKYLSVLTVTFPCRPGLASTRMLMPPYRYYWS